MRHSKSVVLSLLVATAFVLSGTTSEAQNRGRTNRVQTAKPAAKAKARANARPVQTARARTATTPLAQRQTAGNGNVSKPHTKSQEAFKGALKKSNSKFFIREVNGAKRIIANVSGQVALNDVSAAMGADSNVVQILHIGRSDIQHTMAIFDGELVHTQHVSGTGNWRLRNWGDMVRDSNTKMYSAFIALSPAEATKMRSTIANAKNDQGPEAQAGPKWNNGKLKNTSLGGCRAFDCTSTWTDMPLGSNGETLAQIAGFTGGFSRHPKTMQKNLEVAGNERIIGIAVYGPKIATFGQAPAEPVTQF